MTVVSDATGLKDDLRALSETRLDDAVDLMLNEMRDDAPRDSGNMTARISVTDAGGGDLLARTITAPEEYSSYQDEGVEGPIYPVRAKALRFVAKDGSVVFVKSTSGVPRTGWWTDKLARWPEYLARAFGA